MCIMVCGFNCNSRIILIVCKELHLAKQTIYCNKPNYRNGCIPCILYSTGLNRPKHVSILKILDKMLFKPFVLKLLDANSPTKALLSLTNISQLITTIYWVCRIRYYMLDQSELFHFLSYLVLYAEVHSKQLKMAMIIPFLFLFLLCS